MAHDISMRRALVPITLRVGRESSCSAWIFATSPTLLWLCLREEDAVLAQNGALEGAAVAIRLRSEDHSQWIGVSDVRPGRSYGSDDNALRLLEVTLEEDVSGPNLSFASALLVAVDDDPSFELCKSLPGRGDVEVVRTADIRDTGAVGALLLGGAEANAPELESVRATIERFPGMRPILIAKDGAVSDRWSDLVRSGAVFFACSRWPEPEHLARLIVAALDEAAFRRIFRDLLPRRPETEDGFPAFAWYDASVLGGRRYAQLVLRDLATQAERRMPEVISTVYAYDDWAEVLIGPQTVQEEDLAESAALGLVAYAARTGTRVFERHVEAAAFFDPDLDLAPGAGQALMALPVRDHVGTVLGVLACHPIDGHNDAGPERLRLAQLLAHDFAPALAALRQYNQMQGDVGADPTVFRAEAIEEHRRSETPSAILNVSERWGPWIVGALAAFLLAFGVFLILGRATDYAEGMAVVHSRGRIPVVANQTGTVAAVYGSPRSEVAPGDVIGTLYDHAELAEVRRLETEYEDALVRLLRAPDNPAAGQGLATLRAASERARAALEERQLVVPVAGVLTDVRVRPGALVSPGQTVATVGAAGPGFEIVAAVSGNFRPLLSPGLPVVVELEQFPGSRFHLEAREVSPEVISAAEAHALMGQLLPTTDEDAALALVYADLPEVLVSSSGLEHPLYDGMRGSVRIPVREERFIVTLWPALGRGR